MPSDKCSTNPKLEKWKDELKSSAEQLVLTKFPEKVIEYDELLKSEKFQLSRIGDFHVDTNIPLPNEICTTNGDGLNNEETLPKKRKVENDNSDSNTCSSIAGTKVFNFVNGVAPANHKIKELIDIVKPIVREIVENVNKVKMWLLFLIPRIEDGNNFGVAIQEDSLSEVRAVEGEAATFLDQISRYLCTRGKLVSRIAKYPHVEDYREAIVDLDEKEFLNLRLVLTEVRNHYSMLHDVIVKNFEKIKKPRSCHTEHLY